MNDKKHVQRAQRRKKLYAVKMLGGKCQICGYDKCIHALEFHHPNHDKKYSPSYIIMRWSWEKVKEELQKTILICANCHREIHYKELCTKIKREYKVILTKKCKICQKEYKTKRVNSLYCSVKCGQLDRRKTKRPTKEQLYLLLINGERWRTIGKQYNVSDNAVKKWAKQYQIPFKSKEYKNMINHGSMM